MGGFSFKKGVYVPVWGRFGDDSTSANLTRSSTQLMKRNLLSSGEKLLLE